jgi:hypothetical protein
MVLLFGFKMLEVVKAGFVSIWSAGYLGEIRPWKLFLEGSYRLEN